MNNLIGKEFIDIKSGHKTSVMDQFEDVIILKDGNRISYSRIMDKLYYDEVINPADFLKNSDAFISLADKIKKIPDNVLNDTMVENTDSPAVIYIDPEDEYKEMLEKARKMGESMNNNMDVDQVVSNIVDRPQVTTKDTTTNNNNNNNNNNNQHNPIEMLFSQAKKDTKLTVNFSFDINIPKKDFINLMEDTYEYSIINYLANLYTNEILHDDKRMHNEITKSIKEFVNMKIMDKKVVMDNVNKKDTRTYTRKIKNTTNINE